MTQTVFLEDVVRIGPSTKLPKGSMSKFVSMDKLDTYRRKVGGYETQEYKGGAKFINGDTLLARITPSLENGKTAWVDFLEDGEVGTGSTEFIVLRAIEGMTDPGYIYYLSISPDFRSYAIQSMIGTSGRQRVQNDVLSRYRFGLPDIETQSKIVNILGTIDEKIELNRRMNETLEQMGQALFRHYFIDNPEAEKWEDGVVSDLVTIYSGYAFKRAGFDASGKYGLVTIKNVQDGNFLAECSDHLAEVPAKVPDYIHLKTGNILLSLTGNVGRVCIAYGENLLLNQRVAKLAGVNNCHSFAYFMFRQNEFKAKLISMSRGTAQLNLSPIETKKIKIKLPPKDTLENFYNEAEPLLEMVTDNYQQIQTLITLRDTLLPRLINGKVKL